MKFSVYACCFEHNTSKYFYSCVSGCVFLVQVSDQYVIHRLEGLYWVTLCPRSWAPVVEINCTVFPNTDQPRLVNNSFFSWNQRNVFHKSPNARLFAAIASATLVFHQKGNFKAAFSRWIPLFTVAKFTVPMSGLNGLLKTYRKRIWSIEDLAHYSPRNKFRYIMIEITIEEFNCKEIPHVLTFWVTSRKV